MQNSYRDARAKLLFVNTKHLIFAVPLAVAVVVGFVVIRKECYCGNMTSNFSLLQFVLLNKTNVTEELLSLFRVI